MWQILRVKFSEKGGSAQAGVLGHTLGDRPGDWAVAEKKSGWKHFTANYVEITFL